MNGARMKKWIVLTFSAIFLVLGSVGGYAYYKYQQLFQRIYEPLQEENTTNSSYIPKTLSSPPILSQNPGPSNIVEPFTMLLVGVDTRGEENSRSDSMLLAVINPDRKSLSLIPIPRDMYVQVENHGAEKLNHTMFYGGIPLLKKTIEQTFGIHIHRYMTVDFEGFKRLVDEIGGVEIEVKKRMKYTDPTDDTFIDLKKGVQVLDGEKALYYARYRKSDFGRDDSDEERSERQIELIKAIIEQGKDKVSVFKIFSFFDIAGDHIKTDLTKDEIQLLLLTYRDFSPDQIEKTTIQGVDKRLPYGKYLLYFYLVDDEEIARIREFIEERLKTTQK